MDEKIRLIQQKVIKLKSVIASDNDSDRNSKTHQAIIDKVDKNKEEDKNEEVKDHLAKLMQLIEIVNGKLEQNKSKYRLNLHNDKEDIVIDVLIIDDKGNTVQIIKKDITHIDFFDYMSDILEGEGIIFNSLV